MFQSFLQAYNDRENPPLIPLDLDDDEHELLPPSLLLSSAHCNTLELEPAGDNAGNAAAGVDPFPAAAADKLRFINFPSAPMYSGQTPPSPI